MNAKQIGTELVALCREGKNMECIDKHYAEDVESVEAFAMGGGDRVTKGIAAVRGKNEWWMNNHEVHSATAEGPYPHGDDRFVVRFTYDITQKATGQRMKMDEMGLFTLKNGKIAKEEFFYDMG
ncbi:MAG: SnoaL-like domain-containing protein [Sandaracinaceae bacterium]